MNNAPDTPAETVAEETAAQKEVASPEVASSQASEMGNEGILYVVEQLREDVRRIEEVCTDVQSRLGNLETTASETSRQLSFLPPQVRQLGGKVESLNTSISEPRYRAVLLGLLGVYDLVDQLLYTLPSADNDVREADHRRNYEVIRTQLRQLLEANGLVQIATDSAFDPTVHRAAQRTLVADPAQADMILEVVRPGFRTEQSVLRYAEVVVGYYTPAEKSENETQEDDTLMPS